MKRMVVLAVLAILPMRAAGANPAPQQPPQGPPKIEQSKIDAAIKKGIDYLKAHNAEHFKRFGHVNRQMQHVELVLWTYVHADVPETDPAFKELWDDMMKRPLEATYCTALQAMILEEVQRVKHQNRIKHCAQFLVDNQCANGQWTYGEPTIFAEETPTDPGKVEVASAGAPKERGVREFNDPNSRIKPAVRARLKVEQKKTGPASGDNSNTQYAALGMRACYDAGIIIPTAVVDKAMAWYRQSQKASDGPAVKLDQKDNSLAPKGQSGVMDVIMAEPQGWCYGAHADHKAYGSMTAGSVGGLAIWDYIKDDDWSAIKKKFSWRKDKDVHEGLAWLASKWSVTYNPGPYEHGDKAENSQHQYYYYLYALERAGMLYGTEMIGSYWWYAEGSKVLLEKQHGDGSWGGAVDTCFAILFLKRATSPLVATVGGRAR